MNQNIPVKATEWIDFKCQDQKKVLYSDNQLLAKEVCCLFGKKKITNKSTFLVKLHFVNLAAVGIKRKVGNGDDDQEYDSILFRNQGNQEGMPQGYQSGDSIRFSVDFDKQTIQLSVNDKLVYDKHHQLLANKDNWVPFIFLQEQGDFAQLYQ